MQCDPQALLQGSCYLLYHQAAWHTSLHCRTASKLLYFKSTKLQNCDFAPANQSRDKGLRYSGSSSVSNLQGSRPGGSDLAGSRTWSPQWNYCKAWALSGLPSRHNWAGSSLARSDGLLCKSLWDSKWEPILKCIAENTAGTRSFNPSSKQIRQPWQRIMSSDDIAQK